MNLLRDQKTKTGSLERGQMAGKEEESMDRGRWSLAKKAEGVPGWRTPRWDQKMGKVQQQEWKGAQTVTQSFHRLKSLLSTREVQLKRGLHP